MKTELEFPNTNKFPRLYRSVKDGFVVLFCDYKRGAVVWKGDCDILMGDVSKEWANCADDNFWEPLPIGTKITITQE